MSLTTAAQPATVSCPPSGKARVSCGQRAAEVGPQITVGTSSFGYSHRRNFTDLPYRRTRFLRVRDCCWAANAFARRLLRKSVVRLEHTYFEPAINASSVDMYHFFNTITPSKKPWLVTFEASVPRLEAGFERGYRWLAADSCKAIIAMSDTAHRRQLYELNNFSKYSTSICKKLSILHPPQPVLVNAPKERPARPVVFTFVGSAFFRKGGYSLLHAFARLKRAGADAQLNIVSSLSLDGYCDGFVDNRIRQETADLIRHTPGVHHYPGLPNTKAIELLKASDVGVLPSHGETYGYSLLEAMACGCAVVAPAMQPFTDFVPDAAGYFLNVPTVPDVGIEAIDFSLGYPAILGIITDELFRIMGEIENHPETLPAKGDAGLKRIREHHCPATAARKLEDLYSASVAHTA